MSDKFDQDPKEVTLEDAKEWLRKHFADGASCPCCDQYVKLYKRKLNSSMAYALLMIYKFFENNSDEWLHVPSYLSRINSTATVRGGDWSKLRHWGLIEAQKAVRDDGSERVGHYRITELGKQFVRSQARVRKHVYLYNQRPIKRPDDETVSIVEALGEKFDYTELMSAT